MLWKQCACCLSDFFLIFIYIYEHKRPSVKYKTNTQHDTWGNKYMGTSRDGQLGSDHTAIVSTLIRRHRRFLCDKRILFCVARKLITGVLDFKGLVRNSFSSSFSLPRLHVSSLPEERVGTKLRRDSSSATESLSFNYRVKRGEKTERGRRRGGWWWRGGQTDTLYSCETKRNDFKRRDHGTK